ncbi:MAG: aminotransferase class IV [Pirellulales bacterium]
MHEPLAYLNGRFLPASQAALPVDDTGVVLGATVSEQLRTFGGRLFHRDDHLKRLQRSLGIVGIDPGLDADQLAAIAEELATKNHALLTPGDDLGLAMLVTPGPYATFAHHVATRPTVCLHTFPLPFDQWAAKYTRGQSLVVTGVEQVSPHCWPPELKCRSRMHYYLADRQARAVEPESRALLLDRNGLVTETATANIALYFKDRGLVTPPHAKVLPGISLAVLGGLARSLSVPWGEEEVTPDTVASADEVLITSTPNCVLPVVRFNGRPIGAGVPGDVYRGLLAAWSGLVGLDIAAQARQFADRRLLESRL